MKLSGRKFADRYVQKKLRPKTETLDGIIFEVDWSEYVCKCKIQGSDEYVNAHYPRNRATIPKWMKPGNAVRLLHRAGVRGHTEVIGHGGAIPTPQPGSPSHPAISGLANGIVSGLQLTAAGGMSVNISPGTYRINGTIYILDSGDFGYFVTDETDPEITTDETYPPAQTDQTFRYIRTSETDPPMTTDEAIPPAATGDTVMDYTLDPLSPDTVGQFRYDAFQIGTDGIIDYVKGVQSYGTEPLKPDISADHVQIGKYILVVGTGSVSTTEITDENIGWEWTAPFAAGIEVSAPTDMLYTASQAAITVTVVNQYGYQHADQRTYSFDLIRGTGTIDYGGTSDTSLEVTSASGQVAFTYTRDTSDCAGITDTLCETSPHIRIVVSGEDVGAVSGGFEEYVFIQLWNEAGFKMSNVGENRYEGTNYVDPSGGSIAIDWDDGIKVETELDQDATLSMTGGIHGDKLTWLIRQDSTGGWEITFPSNVKFGDQITAVNLSVSTVADSRTYLGFIYDAQTDSYDLVANVSGYV